MRVSFPKYALRCLGLTPCSLSFGGNRILEMDTATVRPSQMRGIEINPRAAVIAELVLWIGYLQWHLRTNGDAAAVSEPVLEDAKNIETRDAILTSDDKQIVRDEAGRPKTHWDGRTTKPHPVTGRPVPDEHAQLPIYSYDNPRPATWPQADFIVGNPPFIGASRMRDALGDGYVETLRKTIKTVPESADFVMYWWNHAAELVRQGKARRFGFVTTNSIRQTFNRRVLEAHLNVSHASTRLSSSKASVSSSSKVARASSLLPSPPNQELSTKNQELSLIFAIPDHPWVDDVEAAAARVAMTVGEAGTASGLLQTVESEEPGDESFKVQFKQVVGNIAPDLTVGADVASAVGLEANMNISGPGVKLHGAGFIVTPSEDRE